VLQSLHHLLIGQGIPRLTGDGSQTYHPRRGHLRGGTISIGDGRWLKYFLSDHLGSIFAVLDGSRAGAQKKYEARQKRILAPKIAMRGFISTFHGG